MNCLANYFVAVWHSEGPQTIYIGTPANGFLSNLNI